MTPWHDLSQEFYGGMPHSPVLPSPTLETLRCVDTDGINVQQFTAVTHVGTHVDAPRHFVPGGATVDDFDVERFAGEGVVVDVSREAATEITVAEFEAAPGEVREGDVVLVYTGWGRRYGDDDYDPHPWLSTALAEWLVERDVAPVGLDVTTPDLPGAFREEGWDEYPVHRTLLGDGVLIAEHLGGLDAVAGRRLEVYAFPLKVRGADGAPVRFVGRTQRAD